MVAECACAHTDDTLKPSTDSFAVESAPGASLAVSSAEPQTGHSGETRVQTIASRSDKSLSPVHTVQ